MMTDTRKEAALGVAVASLILLERQASRDKATVAAPLSQPAALAAVVLARLHRTTPVRTLGATAAMV